MKKIKKLDLKLAGSLFVVVFLFASIAIIVKYLPQQREIRPRAADGLLFEDLFDSGFIDSSKWGQGTDAGGSGITWGRNGTAVLYINNAANAYADLYSKTSFPVGATFEASVNLTGPGWWRDRWYDHRGIGFANGRVNADCGSGETEAVIWRGQDADGYSQTETGGAANCQSFIQNYPDGWRTIKIVRVSNTQAQFYENGTLYHTHFDYIPTGNLPIRFSGYTHNVGAPAAPYVIEVDWVRVTMAPTVDIQANYSNGPITVSHNSTVTLSWSSTYADSCSASGSWSGSKATNGSQSGPLAGPATYTYILSCSGSGGNASDSVTVNVNAPPPTVDIQANYSNGPITVNHNSVITLSWSSTNATSCSASGAWSGSKGTNSSQNAGPLAGPATYTYTLGCSGSGGNASDSVMVNVNAPPPTADIKANGLDGPIFIAYNTAATISWSSNYATSCSVSPGSWTGTSGSQSTGNLIANTTYTLSCTGAGGSASDSVTVNVASKIGDFNGDGKVDILDFSKMLTYWGTNEPSCDPNHDGVVDILDFSALLTNWEG